jgi:aryl-alcohol dehydrogenase-like predicted oxidoreductase
MVNRREFIGVTLSTGVTLALTPELLRAFQQSGPSTSLRASGKMIQRAIPSSGEMLPVISFAPRPTAPPGPGDIQPQPTDVPMAREVLKAFVDNGGKVVDVLHGGPIGEQAARTAARELGIQDKFFWTTPLAVSVPVLPGYAGAPPKPDAAAIRAEMDAKFDAFKVPMIDLVMVSSGVDVAAHLAVLRQMKKEARIRYIGVHDLLFPPNMPAPAPPTARLESIIRNEEIDVIGTDYSVGDRRVEETLLPLAQSRKVGFLAYFPFDRGRIFKRIGTTPLPEWAAEFDAKTWAQFCLKYVVSHPAVTLAREGTTNAAHMLDNIAGGTGRLPNEAMRKRMAAFVDALPPNPPPGPPQPPPRPNPANQPAPVAIAAEILDRYAGEYLYAATAQTAIFRRNGDRLLVKFSGNFPEAPLTARSQTRFDGPFGLAFEFQADGKGAVVLQGPYRIRLERK